MKKIDAIVDKRLADNLTILETLKKYIESNPSIRFSQALINLNIIKQHINVDRNVYWEDEYYIEPGEIIKRMGK